MNIAGNGGGTIALMFPETDMPMDAVTVIDKRKSEKREVQLYG